MHPDYSQETHHLEKSSCLLFCINCILTKCIQITVKNLITWKKAHAYPKDAKHVPTACQFIACLNTQFQKSWSLMPCFSSFIIFEIESNMLSMSYINETFFFCLRIIILDLNWVLRKERQWHFFLVSLSPHLLRNIVQISHSSISPFIGFSHH